MKEEINIKLDASHIAILNELNPYERGVVLSTIFSLIRGTMGEDGLVAYDGEFDTSYFSHEGVDDDRYDALMTIARGIVSASQPNN